MKTEIQKLREQDRLFIQEIINDLEKNGYVKYGNYAQRAEYKSWRGMNVKHFSDSSN